MDGAGKPYEAGQEHRRTELIGVEQKEITLALDVVGVDQHQLAAHECIAQDVPVDAKVGEGPLQALDCFTIAALLLQDLGQGLAA